MVLLLPVIKDITEEHTMFLIQINIACNPFIYCIYSSIFIKRHMICILFCPCKCKKTLVRMIGNDLYLNLNFSLHMYDMCIYLLPIYSTSPNFIRTKCSPTFKRPHLRVVQESVVLKINYVFHKCSIMRFNHVCLSFPWKDKNSKRITMLPTFCQIYLNVIEFKKLNVAGGA